MGGTGDQTLGGLGGFSVNGTLIAGNGFFNAEVDGATALSGIAHGNGDSAYMRRFLPPVLEPGTLMLLGIGLLALVPVARRRRPVELEGGCAIRQRRSCR